MPDYSIVVQIKAHRLLICSSYKRRRLLVFVMKCFHILEASNTEELLTIFREKTQSFCRCCGQKQLGSMQQVWLVHIFYAMEQLTFIFPTCLLLPYLRPGLSSIVVFIVFVLCLCLFLFLACVCVSSLLLPAPPPSDYVILFLLELVFLFVFVYCLCLYMFVFLSPPLPPAPPPSAHSGANCSQNWNGAKMLNRCHHHITWWMSSSSPSSTSLSSRAA